MKCLKCNSTQSKVVDSRHADELNAIRRRRECENCGTRFTTFEHIEVSQLIVVKKMAQESSFQEKRYLMDLCVLVRNDQLDINNLKT